MPKKVKEITFAFRLIDKGNCEIQDAPQLIKGRDFGHALQRLAAALPYPDKEVEMIEIWRGS